MLWGVGYALGGRVCFEGWGILWGVILRYCYSMLINATLSNTMIYIEHHYAMLCNVVLLFMLSYIILCYALLFSNDISIR